MGTAFAAHCLYTKQDEIGIVVGMMTRGHKISKVAEDSIAWELGVEPGMYLVSVNGQEIEDIFDYTYAMSGTEAQVLIREENGEETLLEVEKDENEDFGLEFESPLMNGYRSCSNRCIFCFIDQMPKGMRPTLYFKDDDSRLSFLQGNYVTLTNMSDHDIERIIRYRMEPINISVQTTNPELRVRMLHNRFAGEALRKMKQLKDAGIAMNGQIVLCKGWNDGEELDRTIRDLTAYLPEMQSVSVVPVGLSRYREGLEPLEPFTAEDAGKVIDQIEKWQQIIWDRLAASYVPVEDGYPAEDESYADPDAFPAEDESYADPDAFPAGDETYADPDAFPAEDETYADPDAFPEEDESRPSYPYGEAELMRGAPRHFIHASDEWYILAGRELPPEESYDGYIQYENGVGMLRLLISETEKALAHYRREAAAGRIHVPEKRVVTDICGLLAAPYIERLSRMITEAFPGTEIRVSPIRNDFFGERITVTGLLTCRDIIRQLKERQDRGEELGEELLLPVTVLRRGEEVFLDDLTTEDLVQAVGLPVRVVGESGDDFVRAQLGLSNEYREKDRQYYE